MGWKKGIYRAGAVLIGAVSIGYMVGCSGKARELSKGGSLGPPVLDDGETRTDGADFGQIYNVTDIIEASSDIPEWTNTDLPFTGGRKQLGQSGTNIQWPFKFTYTYPPNNFKLNEAYLVLVTQRDNSDTEGIFVDGVMTGFPPAAQVNASSTVVQHRYYKCTGCNGAIAPSTPSNAYFMDWALTHYKIGTPNSFSLDIKELLKPTALSIVDVVNDGIVRVVTGDDAAVSDSGPNSHKPLLMLEGVTVSKTPLSCVYSPSYNFSNTYIHNDGNSIGEAAMSGTVMSPVTSWGTTNLSFRSVEWYYDAELPRISSLDRLTLTKAEIVMRVKRAASGDAAIVISGVGVSQAGFNRGQATSVVESWDDSTAATTYWESFVSGIPANNTQQDRTLDLISLLGAQKVKELIAGGKLNISVAGSLATVYGQAATSTRTYGVQVNGPDLVLQGNYDTQICEVPNDPNSPISDSSGSVGSCELDQASPIVSSIQVTGITSNSATIQWLTNEPADTQIGYGITSPSTDTPLDSSLVSFHSVQLTGLDPYKYYQYAVKSRDGCGNLSISSTKTFRTLR